MTHARVFNSIANGLDKYFMRIQEIIEAKPSKEYCKNTPAHKMSASFLSSCKSQGYKSRDSKVPARYGGSKKRRPIKGHVKGKEYGGPLPDYS